MNDDRIKKWAIFQARRLDSLTAAANTVYAGATSGGSRTAAFRALVADDLPDLDDIIDDRLTFHGLIP